MTQVKSFSEIKIGDTFCVKNEYDITSYILLAKNVDTICVCGTKEFDESFSMPLDTFDLNAKYGELYKKGGKND